MEILPEPIAFEWDKGNLSKNLHKHDVTYQEAEEVLSSDPIIVTSDAEHSSFYERRYWALGKTKSNRKLFAAFSIPNNEIRVISVRDMTEMEEDVYEDFEKNS